MEETNNKKTVKLVVQTKKGRLTEKMRTEVAEMVQEEEAEEEVEQ